MGTFRLTRAVGVLYKAKTVRRRWENKRECGEEERVPDELLADEGRQVDIDGKMSCGGGRMAAKMQGHR